MLVIWMTSHGLFVPIDISIIGHDHSLYPDTAFQSLIKRVKPRLAVDTEVKR